MTEAHSYTLWGFSGTEHWRKCRLCLYEKPSSREAHSGGGATCTTTGKCDGCRVSYYRSHVFSSEWTYGGNLHWHKCLYCDERSGLSEHAWIWQDDGNGNHVRACGTCGAKESHAYAWGSWQDDGNGKHVRTCGTCGIKESVPHLKSSISQTSAAGHSYECATCAATWTTEAHMPQTIPGTAATCTAAGLTDGGKCETCGYVITAQQEIPIQETAHPAGSIKIDPAVPATCSTPGKTEGSHCEACGKPVAAQQEIPIDPGAHPAGSIVKNEDVAATCTSPGKTGGSHCAACGKTITAAQTVPALGHLYTSWKPADEGRHAAKCSRCGQRRTADCVMTAAPQTDPDAAPISICPICGYCEGGESLAAVKGAKLTGSATGGALAVYATPNGEDGWLTIALVRNGKLVQPKGKVTLTIPASSLEGMSLTGVEYTAAGNTVKIPLDFADSPALFLKMSRK